LVPFTPSLVFSLVSSFILSLSWKPTELPLSQTSPTYPPAVRLLSSPNAHCLASWGPPPTLSCLYFLTYLWLVLSLHCHTVLATNSWWSHLLICQLIFPLFPPFCLGLIIWIFFSQCLNLNLLTECLLARQALSHDSSPGFNNSLLIGHSVHLSLSPSPPPDSCEHDVSNSHLLLWLSSA
jgi:hypothetical protein